MSGAVIGHDTFSDEVHRTAVERIPTQRLRRGRAVIRKGRRIILMKPCHLVHQAPIESRAFILR